MFGLGGVAAVILCQDDRLTPLEESEVQVLISLTFVCDRKLANFNIRKKSVLHICYEEEVEKHYFLIDIVP